MSTQRHSPDDLLRDREWVKKITKRGNIAAEVAQVLFRARVRIGMTQTELARKIRTTQSSIARAESGSFVPGLKFIEKIARAYKTHARIVLESMPDVVPVAVQYAYLNTIEGVIDSINDSGYSPGWFSSPSAPTAALASTES